MKRICLFIVLGIITLGCGASAQAEDEVREKLGVDSRHAVAANITFSPSTQPFRWRMVTTWSKSLLFHDIAVHFCDSVRLASGGRLDITAFSDGELVPAMQTFDAVSQGVVEVGHDWIGYWKSKNEGFVPLASVPFGLDAEGYNIWLYERGGLKMMQDLYGRYNLYALPCGQVGQEMGLFSNKRVTKMADFSGMRVRTVGWYMDILKRLGVVVSPLSGSEIYPALERGAIDAAEFSTPAINYSMAFDKITKYAIEPGVHQPGSQCAVFFNQAAWNSLPEDLKWIVDIAAKETQHWSYQWINNLNAEAIRKYQGHLEIVRMDKETLIEFRKVTQAYLDELKTKYPDVKMILDSQEAFIKEYEDWRNIRTGATPWSYESYISGKITE